MNDLTLIKDNPTIFCRGDKGRKRSSRRTTLTMIKAKPLSFAVPGDVSERKEKATHSNDLILIKDNPTIFENDLCQSI
jgi:hypothetical protein